MPFSLPPQQRLTRDAFAAIQRDIRAGNDGILDRALTAIDGYDPITGQTDHDLLGGMVMARYGTGIRKDPETGWGVYTHQDTATALDHGMMERISVRTYRRIVEVSATLFSAPDQSVTFTGADGEPLADGPDAEAIALLQQMREEGGWQRTMVRADRVGVGLGSCLARVMWRGGRLAYEAVPPQCVRVGYGMELADGDERRATDTGDIEDASVVVVRRQRLSDEQGDQRSQYIAWFGRSELLPAGRCVEYLARNWYEIPEPGMGDIIYEHTVAEQIANPLTALQNQHGVAEVPHEYPLVPIYGTDSSGASVLPLNGRSLYDACLEIDLAWSRVLKCALQAAAKTAVHKQSESSQRNPPACIEGAVTLAPHEELDWKGLAGADVQAAMEVVLRLMQTVCEAWSVPGFMVVQDANGPESGVALALRMQPLISSRESREMINRSSLTRLFSIERSVIAAATGTLPWAVGVKQSWYPGRVAIPRNEKEFLEQIEIGLRLKVIDLVDAIREYHQFATAEEAQSYAELIATRSTETPVSRAVGARVGRAPVAPGAGAVLEGGEQ